MIALTQIHQRRTPGQVVLGGRNAKPETVTQRLEICRRCEKRRVTPTGIEWCGICGCKAGGKELRLDALVAYEENLPRWGCKHPQRNAGKGWPVRVTSGESRVSRAGGGNGQETFQVKNIGVKNISDRNLPDQVRPPSLLFTAENEPANLKNLYRGRSCFLICGGPSFANLDHSKLAAPGLLTMGVNNSAKTFRPNLWTCADSPDNFIRSIWLDPTILKLTPVDFCRASVFNSDTWSYLNKTVADCPNVFFFKRHLGFDAAKFLAADTCCWGNDDSHGGAKSVMLPALRLLHHLGIRRIFLLGCDFQMSGSHAYHFNQRRGADSVRGNNTSYDVLRQRFKQLRPILEAAGLHVFNCNPESKLDAFDKITFDKAIALCLEEWGNINVATERTAGLYDRPKPKPQSSQPARTLPTSFKQGLTVITCTRNRPEAFKLLERWLRRQTRKWDQWLVVNDGQQRYEYTLGQEVIARVPVQGEGHSLAANLLAALPRIRHEHIVFVEDDDWLGPTFLESMSAALRKAPLVGNVPALYYNVATGRWQDMRNSAHASLGQTAMRAKLLPLLAEIARRGSPQIDIALWRKWSGKKKFIRSAGLHVGIKGMPGESGIGIGHKADFGKADAKPNFGTLRGWIGEDVNAYVRPKPVVSVSTATGQTACIITCHNYGRYLRQCIESCLGQTMPFGTIVVVNDTSNDDTHHVATQFSARRTQYLHGTWRNYSIARNKGYELVGNASAVLFVDADNWLAPNYAELLWRGLVSPNTAACYGRLRRFDDYGRQLGDCPHVRLFDLAALHERNLADACALIRRDAFEQAGKWNELAETLSDWELWMTLARMGWRMKYVQEAVLHYRVHDQQMSKGRTAASPKHVASLSRAALICVVTLFAGRFWALQHYKRFLSAIDWPRDNLHIVAIDNSGDKQFHTQLLDMLSLSGLSFSLRRCDRRLEPEVTSAVFCDSRVLRTKNAYDFSAHMARLYAEARQFVPTAAGYVWTVEDDIEPPPHALHALMSAIYQHQHAAVVTGCARSRFREGSWLLWKQQGVPGVKPPDGAAQLMESSGFYCALFRRPAFEDLAFRPSRDWTKRNCAYDWAAYQDIQLSGRQLLAVGDVICKHWRANGTHL